MKGPGNQIVLAYLETVEGLVPLLIFMLLRSRILILPVMPSYPTQMADVASALVNKSACTLLVRLDNHNEIVWESVCDNLVAEMPNLDEAYSERDITSRTQSVRLIGSMPFAPFAPSWELCFHAVGCRCSYLSIEIEPQGVCLANVQMMRCHATMISYVSVHDQLCHWQHGCHQWPLCGRWARGRGW